MNLGKVAQSLESRMDGKFEGINRKFERTDDLLVHSWGTSCLRGALVSSSARGANKVGDGLTFREIAPPL